MRYKNKSEKTDICTKSNIIDYLVVLLIDILGSIFIVIGTYYEEDNSDELCTFDSLEIIIICILTAIFFKYKYHIHHIISLIIFLILSIIIDLMVDNFKGQDFTSIIVRFLYVLLEAFAYCFSKYLMDIKYRHFWNISFAMGVCDLTLFSITFAILLIITNTSNNTDVLPSLDKYKEDNIGYIIFRILFGIISGGFFCAILEFETINIFNPNHVFVCYEISRISTILMKADDLNDWLSIIPFVFQIIILLFYLEIFEFNFCNLNKNTKRNIRLREKKDSLIIKKEKEINVIELKQGYYLKDKEETEETEETVSFGNFETVVKKKYNKK